MFYTFLFYFKYADDLWVTYYYLKNKTVSALTYYACHQSAYLLTLSYTCT